MDNITYREDGTPIIVVPFKLRHLGYKQTIVVEDNNCSIEDIAKEPLPRALILAQQYANMIESGKFSTVNELANYLKFDRSHVARTLSLVNLAPDIVMAIMSGKAPESVTLNKILYGLPDNWQEQHEFLGMS
jgi:hypothetical protein